MGAWGVGEGCSTISHLVILDIVSVQDLALLKKKNTVPSAAPLAALVLHVERFSAS